MSVVNRFDRGELAEPRIDANGFLHVEGKVSRIGVQKYRNADGTEHGEFRSPEDVFAPTAMQGFAQMPLTENHPMRLLTPETAKQYTVGAVGDARREGDWVVAPISIFDKATLDAVKKGKNQLSVGYSVELVDEPGEYKGEKYQYRQRAIQVNHVAVVDTARAGKEAALRLDGTDAMEVLDDLFIPGLSSTSTPKEPLKMAIKVRTDGFDIELSEANAQSVLDKATANARKDAESKQEAAEKALVAEKKLTADEKARADALKAKLDKMVECDTCDGKGKIGDKDCKDCGGKGEYSEKSDAEVLAKRRADRKAAVEAGRKDALAQLPVLADLHGEAKKYLGPDHKIDKTDIVSLQKAIAQKLNAELKLDGKSNDYVLAMYDAELAKKAKEPNASDNARAAALKLVPNTDEAPSDPEAARKAYAQRQADAWKPKK